MEEHQMELSFSVTDGYTDSGKPVKEGLFSRDMDDEHETDALLERLEEGINMVRILDGIKTVVEFN